ncbi:TonB family protein [Roseateles cavernae]|uniref:TonB family protein n=1 Tax=Roseateles cavernae TaxID=3153578 RepID=UPI0032E41959
MRAERRRPTTALLLSLLIHALLLSLSFGGDGPGLPGLVFPWQERRAEAPELRVVLTQAPQTAAPAAAAAPAEAAEPAPELAAAPEPAPPELPAPAPQQTVAAVASLSVMAPEAMVSAEPPVADPGPDEPAAAAEPMPPTLLAPPDVIRALRPDSRSWALPAVPATLPLLPAITAAPSASSPQTRELHAAATMAPLVQVDAMAVTRAPELAVLDRVGGRAAQELEARLEAARQEAMRAEALRQEAIRQAAARQESARLEAERLQAREAQALAQRAAAEQQAAARQEAARQEEVLRQEAARVEAQRQATARQAAAVTEAAQAAREEMDRQDAARVEAARLAAAKAEAKAQAEAQREERLRAIGRQLNEEAARRDAIAARLPPSASSIRRGRLFGRSDANAELVLYAEAWSRKIELNQTFELVREAARQPHAEPLVTVAVRSDGSVESVSFVRSSGVPAIDAAVRRIVESQANYPAFPPALAREFDVIEIRRTWRFDMAVRLY